MKIKVLAVGAFAVLAFSTATATAGSGKNDKITGGGQVLLGSEDVKRSTIAFTAQGTNQIAKGQVQFIDRSAGAGKNQVKYHGVVDCVETLENYGIASGYKKGDTTPDEGPRFVLRVLDNGEGANAENDMIAFDDEVAPEDDTCQDDEQEDDDEFTIALAKGNAQVKDGDSANAPEFGDEEASLATALALF